MRGEIRNREFVQVNDFSGLRISGSNITPTDLDGFIDFGNRLFILFELKHGDAAMPRGQQLALERLADAIQSPPTLLIEAHHNTPAAQDVDAALARVTRYRWKGRWLIPRQPMTIADMVAAALLRCRAK